MNIRKKLKYLALELNLNNKKEASKAVLATIKKIAEFEPEEDDVLMDSKPYTIPADIVEFVEDIAYRSAVSKLSRDDAWGKISHELLLPDSMAEAGTSALGAEVKRIIDDIYNDIETEYPKEEVDELNDNLEYEEGEDEDLVTQDYHSTNEAEVSRMLDLDEDDYRHFDDEDLHTYESHDPFERAQQLSEEGPDDEMLSEEDDAMLDDIIEDHKAFIVSMSDMLAEDMIDLSALKDEAKDQLQLLNDVMEDIEVSINQGSVSRMHKLELIKAALEEVMSAQDEDGALSILEACDKKLMEIR